MTIIDTHSCTVPGLGVGAFHKHDMHGINQRRAVEKLRELARKAICARLILAAGDDPLWPITDTGSIDRRLLDDTFRDRCVANPSIVLPRNLGSASSESQNGNNVDSPYGHYAPHGSTPLRLSRPPTSRALSPLSRSDRRNCQLRVGG